MSTTLKNIKIPYPTEGVIRSAQLYDTVSPENSVQLAVNLNFDVIGAMTTRSGVSTFATTLPTTVKNFGTLNIQGGGNYLYAHVNNNNVYAWDGAAWTSVRAGVFSNKARFAQYLNYIYMVNGWDPMMASTNGGAFSVVQYIVPSAPAMPIGDFISAGFGGRVWVASKAQDILYYSDVVQFHSNGIPAPFVITYNTENYIKYLSPQDGQSITGLFRVPRALLVFKQDTIIRVYAWDNVDPFPAYNVGTYSQESIVQAKDGVYFHHSSGFYKFSLDGQPIEISRRVIDFVKAIPKTSYENVLGIYDGFDNVEWQVGTVTVEGVRYLNCVMRYSISTQVWTVYDYAAHDITAMIRFSNSSSLNMIMGTAAGRVGKMDDGYTDFGDDIRWEMIDRWRSFTDMWSKSKSISGIMVQSLNGAGSILQYQHQKSTPNEWEYIDTLNEEYDSLFPNASTDDFSVARLRLTGNSRGTPVVLTGIELLSVQDKGFEQN